MAQDEHPAELYDFLYRDTNRLASYYAQIFRSGKFSILEESDSDKRSTDTDIKGNAQVISAGVKFSGENQTSAKRIYDPHDVVTTDVLAFLKDNNYVYTDYETCPNGGIVLVKGTLFFIDSLIMASAASSLDSYAAGNQETVSEVIGQATDSTTMFGMRAYHNLIKDASFPPIYYLETENGIIGGTIKPSGMEEPVTTYVFKYGGSGLPDVYLLGIKEVSTMLVDNSLSELVNAIWDIAENLEAATLPDDNERITPLALFRVIKPIS